MIGLPKDKIKAMLEKDIPAAAGDEAARLVRDKLIPNLVEAIAANNEAIYYGLKEEESYY